MKSLFFCLALLACAGAHAADAPAIKAIDTTQEFVRFWGTAEGKPEAERVQLFLDTVVRAHPELFTKDVLGKQALAGQDAAADKKAVVAAYLKNVERYVPKMREISASINRDLAKYAKEFGAAFPDYASKMPIYFMVSLFDFDGGTRMVDGRMALLFGIDGIAKYHGPEDKLSVLFHHELFHQYHEQIAPELGADEVPIWMSLWEEGLATYVSQKMNPGTSDAEALFSKVLVEKVPAILPAVTRELLDNFDSMDKKEYAAFFYGKNDRTDLPGRSGYYIGLRIAQQLGARHSMQELARMRGPELKAAVRAELEKLAALPKS